jgi:transposase
MTRAVEIRKDYSSTELRQLARVSKDAKQALRLAALAAAVDGALRTEAAAIGAMNVQTMRDTVIRFNERGPEGLINRKGGGGKFKLSKAQRTKVADQLEQGPIPAIHGVVRWRIVDIQQWIREEFRITLSEPTVWRLMRDLGYSHVSGRPQAYRQNEEAIADFKKTSERRSPRSAPKSAPRRRSKSGSRTR